MATSLTCLTKIFRLPDDPLGWTGRLLVPPEVVDQIPRRDDGSQRIVVELAGLDPWHAAITSDGQGGHYIIFNKERSKQLRKQGADDQHLHMTLTPDTSRYGAPMPAELEELLKQDPLGDQYFHELTPGRQRNIIYMLAKYKAESTRMRKSVAVLEYLVTVRGELVFADLYAYLKEHGR